MTLKQGRGRRSREEGGRPRAKMEDSMAGAKVGLSVSKSYDSFGCHWIGRKGRTLTPRLLMEEAMKQRPKRRGDKPSARQIKHRSESHSMPIMAAPGQRMLSEAPRMTSKTSAEIKSALH